MTPSLEHLAEALRGLRKRDATRKNYQIALDRFRAFAGAHPLSFELVEDWAADLSRAGLSPGSVNNYVARISALARRAGARARARGESFPPFTDPWEPLPIPRRRGRAALDLTQVRALLATCAGGAPRDLRDRALLTLALRTAARRGGLRGIDLERVVGGPRGVEIRDFELKGGRLITLRLDPQTTATLAPWMRHLAERGIREGALFRSFRGGRGALGPGDSLAPAIGGRLGLKGIEVIVAARGRQAGLQITPHTLRYTCVSLLRKAGVPDWRIALLTGHKPRLVPGGGEGPPGASYPMLDVYTRDLGGGGDLPEF